MSFSFCKEVSSQVLPISYTFSFSSSTVCLPCSCWRRRSTLLSGSVPRLTSWSICWTQMITFPPLRPSIISPECPRTHLEAPVSCLWQWVRPVFTQSENTIKSMYSCKQFVKYKQDYADKKELFLLFVIFRYMSYIIFHSRGLLLQICHILFSVSSYPFIY